MSKSSPIQTPDFSSKFFIYNSSVLVGNSSGQEPKVIARADFVVQYAHSSLRPLANYVSRPALEQKIRKQLRAIEDPDGDKSQMVVVWGLGGSGKSQLVLNYIQQYRREYTAVFWVEARQKETIQRDYIQIYRLLFSEAAKRSGSSISVEDAVPAVKSWFLLQRGRSLLVVDGADSTDNTDDASYVDLNYYLPDAPRVDIIITTRSSHAQDISSSEAVEVREMMTIEAMELFRNSSTLLKTSEETGDEIRAIVNELGYLALAIALAGSYVADTPRLSSNIQLFLPEYREHRRRLLGRKAIQNVHRYGESVLSTWETTFAAVERQSRVASRLLCFLAFLDFDDIFPSLFNRDSRLNGAIDDSCQTESQQWLTLLATKATVDQHAIESGFATLQTYTLISWRGEQGAYMMHKLVHAWGHDRLELEHRRTWSLAALELLCENMEENRSDLAMQRRLVRHVMANFAAMSKACGVLYPFTSRNRDSIAKIGNFLRQLGQWEQEYKVRLFHVQVMEETLGTEHLDTLSSMDNLALVLSNQGKNEQAKEMYQQTLELRVRILGYEHPDTLSSMDNLALVLSNQGKNEQAEEMHQQTLELRVRILGSEHPDTLSSMDNLALVLSNQGKNEQAEEMYQQTLELRVRILGYEHPDTLSSMDNLALVLSNQGKNEQAEEMYQQTLELRLRMLGSEHPNTLISMSNLAWVLSNQGKNKQAEEIFRQMLELRRSVLGRGDLREAVVETATETLSILLSEDELLAVLVKEAIARTTIGPERFERNFRQSVISYSGSLKKEAKTGEQHLIAGLVQFQAGTIAKFFCKTFAAQAPELDNGRNGTNDDEGDVNSLTDDGKPTTGRKQELQSLSPMEVFLFAGRPFKEFRSDFQNWVLHNAEMPMSQVRNALSYLRDGQHTVNIYVDWQLQQFVRDGLDNPQDLETVLTITGEPDKAYACSCEDYVSFAWGKNNSIAEFFRSFVASRFLSSTRARNEVFFHSDQLTVSVDVEAPTSTNGSERSTFQVTAEKDCLVEVCECLSWLAAVCRPPEPGSILGSSATFENVDVDCFAIRTEPLRPLPSSRSTESIGCCWLDMFNGGYVLAQGFPVPPRKSGRGIELPLDMMIEQAMTYHTISHRGSIILKGSHTALVPISVDGIGILDQAGEVQWHLIGKKPKLVQVAFANESKRTEGYYLTDVEFSTEEPDLSWEAIDQIDLKPLAANSLQEFSGTRAFVGYFPRARTLLGTKESGYEKVEGSDAKLVKGAVVKFEQAINIAMGTNLGTAGLFSVMGSTRLRRTKYDNTPKQVPALTGDQLRNRHNRPHILYDVEKGTAWMIPEACIILYLMHRWASLQMPPPLATDNQQEAPHNSSSSQWGDRSQLSDSLQAAHLELLRSPVLECMPFVTACSGGKKAADAIMGKISQELPKYVRSLEEPEKPLYVGNIVARMYLIIDTLIEHQKRKKPGFFKRQGNRPYIWGYDFVDVASFSEAPAKGVRIDKARSGGWYALTKPKSQIAILFGNKFGDLIRYEGGQTICHHWKSVPTGHNFLSADGEALKYLRKKWDQNGLFKLFLSDENSGIYKRRDPQRCEGNDWPCCNMSLQLESRPPKVTIKVQEGEAVVIGKAAPRLMKLVGKGSQNSERGFPEEPVESQGINGRLPETNERPNGPSSSQLCDEQVEGVTLTEPEQFDSSDDAEFLSCDEYSSEPLEDATGA